MKLHEVHIVEGWGKKWKPMSGWETIHDMKKEVRLNETFVETEIADALQWGSKADIRKYSRWH